MGDCGWLSLGKASTGAVLCVSVEPSPRMASCEWAGGWRAKKKESRPAVTAEPLRFEPPNERLVAGLSDALLAFVPDSSLAVLGTNGEAKHKVSCPVLRSSDRNSSGGYHDLKYFHSVCESWCEAAEQKILMSSGARGNSCVVPWTLGHFTQKNAICRVTPRWRHSYRPDQFLGNGRQTSRQHTHSVPHTRLAELRAHWSLRHAG